MAVCRLGTQGTFLMLEANLNSSKTSSVGTVVTQGKASAFAFFMGKILGNTPIAFSPGHLITVWYMHRAEQRIYEERICLCACYR